MSTSPKRVWLLWKAILLMNRLAAQLLQGTHLTHACELIGCHEWLLVILVTLDSTCVWVYAVSKVLPCSLTMPGGLRTGLTTADLPASLQGKISYQAAAALCPAVWGLCQGFLQKCNGVHQAAGGKRRWRRQRERAKPLGGVVTRFPKNTGRHLSELSSKITFKPPKCDTLSCMLWLNGGSVAMDTAASKGQSQVFLISLETGYWQP